MHNHGARKQAVYGHTIGVDRAVWTSLDYERQGACLAAGIVILTHAAPATEMLTVRDIGAPPTAGAKRKRGKPQAADAPEKLSAVVRTKRGCTYYG